MTEEEPSKVIEQRKQAIGKIPPIAIYACMTVALLILIYVAYLLFKTNNDPCGMCESLGRTCWLADSPYA